MDESIGKFLLIEKQLVHGSDGAYNLSEIETPLAYQTELTGDHPSLMRLDHSNLLLQGS